LLKIKKTRLSKTITFTKLIPNIITLLGLIIGVSSVRFALDSKWEIAVYCILIAGILDGIDGRVARLLGATSPFGAELDSLCDFANFGFCPAIIIYLWSFQQYEFKLCSWFAIILFVVCMAIRLARFNTSLYENKESKIAKYFSIGVPAPSGALLALMPIILDFDIALLLGINIRSHTFLIDIYIAIVAFLLASRLPTFLFKNIQIKPQYISLCMIIAAIIIIAVIIYPWYALPLLATLYISSMPFCFMINKKINLPSDIHE
jgi:CDP-diacylglycerol---serine O-phosphatidyltransferase